MYHIVCKSYNKQGYIVFQELYDREHPESAYLIFIKELKRISDYADQTVRITIDIALPDRWYDVKEP